MGFPYKRIGSSPTAASEGGGVFNKFDNYYAEQTNQIKRFQLEANLSGGTIITTPTHKFHSFTSSGSLVNSGLGSKTVSVILVGGGGGGGTDSYPDNRGA